MKAVPAEELAQRMTAALLSRGVSEEHAGYVVDGLYNALPLEVTGV